MCEIYVTDDATCIAWKETARKARIYHRCDCCWRLITPKTVYRHVSGLTADRDPFSHAFCFECAIASDAFGQAHGHMINPETFLEFLDECVLSDEAAGDNAAVAMWRPVRDRIWTIQRRNTRGGQRAPVPQ